MLEKHLKYLSRLKKSTAIYPNRIKDRNKIERLFELVEFGGIRNFYTLNNTLIATEYTRIVYGDHGPYVEFELAHFIVELAQKFNNAIPFDAYYEWMTIHDGSDIKVYRQLRDVRGLPNPPNPGYRGNRIEGYADYTPGKYYISPFEMKIV